MENMTLLKGDCLKLLKDIPDGNIDAIITDPPYCIGVSSNGCKSSVADNSLLIPFWETLFREYKRVLKEGAPLYINTDWRTYPMIYEVFCGCFDMRNLIVWDYMRMKAGIHYRFSYELIIYGIKGKRKRMFSPSETDIWRIKCINYTDKKNRLHKAQKTVELVERMILNDTHEGDLVLDSFMGSGTTGVACKNTGRRFIGMELDAKYFEVAKNRIENL